MKKSVLVAAVLGASLSAGCVCHYKCIEVSQDVRQRGIEGVPQTPAVSQSVTDAAVAAGVDAGVRDSANPDIRDSANGNTLPVGP